MLVANHNAWYFACYLRKWRQYLKAKQVSELHQISNVEQTPIFQAKKPDPTKCLRIYEPNPSKWTFLSATIVNILTIASSG